MVERKLVGERLLACLIAAATIAFIAPAGAGASTTVGETFTPIGYQCGDHEWELQTTSPSSTYVVPSAGILTSFSYLGGADQPPNGLKLEVARTTATPNQYLTVGVSAEKFPAINTMNTYTDISIPVQAGDILGLHSNGNSVNCGSLTSGYTTHYLGLTDPSAGDTVTTMFTAGLRLDISATLEADCDADGLGDETEDPDTSSCNSPPAPRHHPNNRADRPARRSAQEVQEEEEVRHCAQEVQEEGEPAPGLERDSLNNA
jgi:hypothetical protein